MKSSDAKLGTAQRAFYDLMMALHDLCRKRLNGDTAPYQISFKMTREEIEVYPWMLEYNSSPGYRQFKAGDAWTRFVLQKEDGQEIVILSIDREAIGEAMLHLGWDGKA